MYQRIIFIDPSLSSQYSHNYRYAQTLNESFPDTRIEIYSSKSFAAKLQGVNVHPVFDVDMYDEYAFVHDSPFMPDTKAFDPRVQFVADVMNSMGFKGDFWAKLLVGAVRIVRGITGTFARICKLDRAEYQTPHKLAQQLFASLRRANLKADDLVIFPTALGSVMEALMTVRCFNHNQAWPAKAAFIMHFDYHHYSNGYATFSRRFYDKRVIENMPFSDTQVCVLSEPLAKRLRDDLDLDPVVVQDLVVSKGLPQRSPRKSSIKTRILIPGKYMWDKNFEAVPDYLKALIHSDCEVTLHASVLQHIHLDEALLNRLNVYEDIAGDREWLEFLASFDCLLLTYGEKYRYRISGILTEAKAVGIPTIVSHIAADSSRVNAALVFENAEQIPSCVTLATSPQFNLDEAYIESSAPTFADALQNDDLFVQTKHKPICIQIKPGWVRCGSSLVFENQIEYLLHRNYFVVELFAKNIIWNRTKDQVAEAYDLLLDNRRDVGGALAYFVRPNPSILNIFDWLTKARWLARSKPIARYNHLMKSFGIPGAVKQLIAQDGVDLVVCNHVYHLGLADRFHAKRVICETHDIQSRQYQIRGILPDEFAYNRSIEEELEILEQSADLLINISGYENYFFSNRVNKPSLLCKPYREVVIPDSDRKSSLEEFIRCNVTEELIESSLTALGSSKTMDMFFVGDGHHANIESFKWFVDSVLSQLSERKLFLGGTISKAVAELYPDHDQIIHLGYIKSLDNVYDFVDVAVLPDQDGAGIPIKTVDVLSHGAAFVATTKALRGLDWLQYSFLPTDDACDMVDDIERLLGNKAVRTERQQLALQMAKAFSRESYFETWDSALSTLENKIQ